MFYFTEKTDLKVKMWYEHVTGPDGKIHWNITKHDIKYELEKAIFRLENLLGDKQIGESIIQIEPTTYIKYDITIR